MEHYYNAWIERFATVIDSHFFSFYFPGTQQRITNFQRPAQVTSSVSDDEMMRDTVDLFKLL